jgi:hypothetical protein
MNGRARAMSMNVTPKFRIAELTEGTLAAFVLLQFGIRTRAAEAAARSGTDQIPLARISFDLN